MIGQTVSHFKIVGSIGEGGMGVVYKAQDLNLDRFVALKFLPGDLSTDEESKRRFVHEAQAASALDHPNICTIYEIDELPDGRMFMAMAYYDGESLRDRMRDSRLEVDQAIGIAVQVASGLARAHEKGIVHRDIKPANIVITADGHVKILDFGLAKLAGRTRLTRTGSTVGTVAYMSPEQVSGEDVDARSDIFSLGVVFYEMLAGERPFQAPHEAAMMYRIVNEDPTPIENHVSDVPDAVKDVIARALEKNREDRPSSLDELLATLSDGATPLVRTGLESNSRTRAAGPQPNDMIGPYRLRERVGVGGMGEVWSADQLEPFRRKVALKIVKAGMDSNEIVARFEAERQALAMMDHPSIAKVFDAGTTPLGRPFFAMEFIRGVPITEYCDSRKLSTRQRLELFMHLCDGVQHAHQKAVIHRDLKPGNVLVTEIDDHPTPKIIDFGVAKATAQPLTEKTMVTHLGQMIGTPEYMSPEQAELSGEDIDTRSDVYSLGAILYELLVGALPFDSEALREAGFDGVRRMIREQDPATPSDRVTSLGQDSKSAAQRRLRDPSALSHELRGDLDWIVMKALEKDRTRRYASASDLAADIDRHLTHQPVLAGPPSASYRIGKFIRRHRVGVVAASLVVFAMMLGITGTTIGLFRAVRAERTAREEAEAARQVSEFLEGLFAVSDPGEARGNSVTAREILDHGADRIARELEGQPLVEARLMVTMGRVYRRLGLYDEARPLLEHALELRRGELGPGHLIVAGSELELAWLLNRIGDYDAALKLYQHALAIQQAELGSEAPEVAKTLSSVADLHKRARRYEQSRALQEQALAIVEKSLGPEHPEVSNSLELLGNVYLVEGNHAAALPLYERALAIREKALGEDHPRVASVLGNLATVHWQMGNYDTARALNERALAIEEKVLGPDHPDLAFRLNTMANLLSSSGDYGGAQKAHERALSIREKYLRFDHPDLADTYYNLACVCALQGNREKAFAYLTESVDRGFARPVIFNDSDLALLQGDPTFEAILEKMKRRINGDM